MFSMGFNKINQTKGESNFLLKMLMRWSGGGAPEGLELACGGRFGCLDPQVLVQVVRGGEGRSSVKR